MQGLHWIAGGAGTFGTAAVVAPAGDVAPIPTVVSTAEKAMAIPPTEYRRFLALAFTDHPPVTQVCGDYAPVMGGDKNAITTVIRICATPVEHHEDGLKGRSFGGKAEPGAKGGQEAARRPPAGTGPGSLGLG